MKSKTIYILSLIGILIVIVGIILGIMAIFQLSNPQEYKIVNIQIQQELQSNANGSNVKTKYLYLCTLEDGEIIVFENEDSLLNGKFNSSTLLAELKSYEKSGKPFTVKTRGWRIPLFSKYQNIIEIIK